MPKPTKPGGKSLRMTFDLKGPVRPLGVEFDGTGAALYVRIRNGRVARTLEVSRMVLADYDRGDRLLGFEVIGLKSGRTAAVPESIGKKHPGTVPRFELALA